MNEIFADDQTERDEQILKLRVGGASPRAIAKELHCAVSDVNAAVDRLVDQIDNKYRMRTVALELERLDALHLKFYRQALGGDTAAGSLLVKISERRAALLALDSPVKVRHC